MVDVAVAMETAASQIDASCCCEGDCNSAGDTLQLLYGGCCGAAAAAKCNAMAQPAW